MWPEQQDLLGISRTHETLRQLAVPYLCESNGLPYILRPPVRLVPPYQRALSAKTSHDNSNATVDPNKQVWWWRLFTVVPRAALKAAPAVP